MLRDKSYISSIKTDRFTWDREERLYVAEASDLADLNMSQVYDDAIDLGFTLIRAANDRFVMVENHREIDSEGDLLYTDFAITDNRGPVEYPAFGVRIFND